MICSCLILQSLCSGVNEMIDTSISTRHTKRIFQVFVGRWEDANTLDHPGKVFKNLCHYDWKKLKFNLDLTHIYLLGIWNNSGPISVNEEENVDLTNIRNRCPSPFAIKNHMELNPLLGNASEFMDLVDLIHDAGLKIIVDFVPNHTGLDHPWIKKAPEFYKKDSDGSIQKAFSLDVAVLDYNNPDLVFNMRQVLLNIMKLKIDGVRADMAHLIPHSFWKSTISDLKKANSEFVFIGEAYSDNVFDQKVQNDLIGDGFDAVYDQYFYQNILKVINGAPLSYLSGHLEYQLGSTPDKWVRYCLNHDDSFPGTIDQLTAFQTTISLLPGWEFIYNGSLWGRTRRLAHHFVEILDVKMTDSDLLPFKVVDWYKMLADLRPKIERIEALDQKSIKFFGSDNLQEFNKLIDFGA